MPLRNITFAPLNPCPPTTYMTHDDRGGRHPSYRLMGVTIMAKFPTLVAIIAIMGISGVGAAAREPVQVYQGESFSTQYAPGFTGNIVGGGTLPRTYSGDASQADYAVPNFSRTAPGIPTFRGGAEGDIEYLPVPASHRSSIRG
jgi:hypothetical protein